MPATDAKVIELAKAFDRELDILEHKYQMLLTVEGADPLASVQITLTALYANFLKGKGAHTAVLNLIHSEETARALLDALENALANMSEAVAASNIENTRRVNETLGPLIKGLRNGT